MKNNLLQLKLIPPVVALLLTFFVIFPDIIWRYSRTSEDRFPRMERRAPNEFGGNGFPDKPNGPMPRMGKPDGENQQFEFSQYRIPPESQFQNIRRIIEESIFYFVFSYLFMVFDLFLFKNKRIMKNKSHRFHLHVLFINLFLGFIIAITYNIVRGNVVQWPIDGLLLFKCFFISLTTYLIVLSLKLVIRQQRMLVENERLKTQNLEVQYASLTTQLNPHFFFNSMNSLSSLIRAHEQTKSLKYLQKLSDMFRYMLSSNKRTVVTLQEELNMLQAYRYMMEIRYEDKLLFDVQVDKKYDKLVLPVLCLQPLIENAIKHNEISEDKPLTIYIKVEDEGRFLTVSNPIQPKFLKEESTQIGLENLNERYKLLFGAEIQVYEDNGIFLVRIPLFAEQTEKKSI